MHFCEVSSLPDSNFSRHRIERSRASKKYECFIAIASRDDEERTHQKLSHVSPLRNAIGKKIEIGRRGVKNKSKHGMVRRAVRYLRHENSLSMSVQSCRARRQDAPEETEKSTLQPSLVWSSISRIFFHHILRGTYLRSTYRAQLKGFGQVWGILFLLLLHTSA